MQKRAAAITLLAVLLAGCASPVPTHTPTVTPLAVPVQATVTFPPTSTAVPSATPTITPASEGCVRATTEIPEGENPTRYINSGPASGCYDSVGGFLDDIGLEWGEFAPGTVITFWTDWPVDDGGQVVYPTPTPIPISVTISPSMDDGIEYVCGRPPLSVTFGARVSGGSGELEYAWDFDADGRIDATVQNPDPFTYQTAGVYNATLTVGDSIGETSVAQRRIVAVGQPRYPHCTFGVMEHLNNTFGWYPNAASIERVAELMEESDIPAVRVDFVWREIEPARRQYQWTRYDQITDILTSRGIDLIPIITFTPSWASGSGSLFAPPTSPREFGAFAGKIAERYSDRIHVYQVWQEANVSLYFDPPSPNAYSQLLTDAYLNIKYFDPDAVVVMAGLANDASAYYPGVTFIPPEDFLQQLYDDHALFDVVARHPTTHPGEGLPSLIQRMDAIREVMARNDDSQSQLWVTEYAASTNPTHLGGISEEEQAAWLSISFRALLDQQLAARAFWYNFRDVVVDTDPFMAYVGLVHNDLTPKPSLYTFSQLIREYP